MGSNSDIQSQKYGTHNCEIKVINIGPPKIRGDNSEREDQEGEVVKRNAILWISEAREHGDEM